MSFYTERQRNRVVRCARIEERCWTIVKHGHAARLTTNPPLLRSARNAEQPSNAHANAAHARIIHKNIPMLHENALMNVNHALMFHKNALIFHKHDGINAKHEGTDDNHKRIPANHALTNETHEDIPDENGDTGGGEEGMVWRS